jgi:hypothetical protein
MEWYYTATRLRKTVIILILIPDLRNANKKDPNPHKPIIPIFQYSSTTRHPITADPVISEPDPNDQLFAMELHAV